MLQPRYLIPLFTAAAACSAPAKPPATKAPATTSTAVSSAEPKAKAAPPAKPIDPAFAAYPGPRLALGHDFGCLARKDGRVACWGNNEQGQLGLGHNAPKLGAHHVPGLSDVTSVAAGSSHACALRKDGTVWCWGLNAKALLGHEDAKGGIAGPRRVPNVTAARSIAVGNGHSCAVLATEKLRCWGGPARGRLGLDHYDHVTEPSNVMMAIENVTAVALARFTTCARDHHGKVHCWGVGDDKHSNDRTTIEGVEHVVELFASDDSTCARTKSGEVLCWTSDGKPEAVSFEALATVSRTTRHRLVALSTTSLCAAVEADVSCNGDLAVPHESWMQYSDDEEAEGDSEHFAMAHASELHAAGMNLCALGNDDDVQCVGGNEHAQLGRPFGDVWPTPQRVDAASPAVDLDGDGDQMCAVRADGRLHCWGRSFYELRRGAITDAKQVAVGKEHACARRLGGLVSCWGDSDAGQIGLEAVAARKPEHAGILAALSQSSIIAPSFVHTVKGVRGASSVAVSDDMSCALTRTGLLCWGATHVDERNNDDACGGYLGALSVLGGTRKPDEKLCKKQQQPHRIPKTRGAHAAVGMHDGPCTLAGKDELTCLLKAPRPKATIADAVSLHRGHAEICALDGQGNPTCFDAQGGHLDIDFSGPLIDWSSSHAFSCAVTRAGEVQCAGDNSSGQLGNGTTTSHHTPQRVVGIGKAKRVRVGEEHACALLEDGSVWCWGGGDHEVGSVAAVLKSSRTPIRIAMPGARP